MFHGAFSSRVQWRLNCRGRARPEAAGNDLHVFPVRIYAFSNISKALHISKKSALTIMLLAAAMHRKCFPFKKMYNAVLIIKHLRGNVAGFCANINEI